MGDVRRVKRKVMDSIRDYKENLSKAKTIAVKKSRDKKRLERRKRTQVCLVCLFYIYIYILYGSVRDILLCMLVLSCFM